MSGSGKSLPGFITVFPLLEQVKRDDRRNTQECASTNIRLFFSTELVKVDL